ncbi:SDR family oxidoreductase [Ulvibacterium sp.]|uniref:SDR family oxidoreductase n=1 Tax=Ulvibacterium sp. TaxID=2665914 RepID=UPI00260CAC2E|nr:SDR family oxidoreductase [Ulvibacterium sp.]
MKEKVLIIGGSAGMGLATAQQLIKEGFHVIISGGNENRLKTQAKELGNDCEFRVIDAKNTPDLRNLFFSLSGLKHIVVTISVRANASGIAQTEELDAKQAFERFWTSYNVLHFAPEFLNRNGSVTLISGSSAKTPLKGYGVWGTLHGSINSLVKQAAIDIAPIRVNAISPGGIGLRPDRQLVEHKGQAEDIAKMIVAVITNRATTASIIDVDGGERQGTWSG